MTQATTGALPPSPSHDVLEQAACWYARLRDGTAATHERAEWQTWLDADQAHRVAWRYVEDISRAFAPLRDTPDARRTAEALNTATGRLHTRRHILAGIALAAGGGLLGWLGWRQAPLPASLLALRADQRTGTGEQRDITLADGSRLWLNTGSAVNVIFSSRERVIVLVEGEVFISTAKDTARPLIVETTHGRMRALGTRFNVRLDDGQTRLAVYEGAVEIRAASGTAARVIPAGQQVRFSGGDIAIPESADVAREAWTQGTLVADNIPLREVIAELRRYRRGHLGVSDDVADLKVYGNFPIQDTDRVLHMLASVLPIRFVQSMPWWTTIEAKR